MGPDPDVYPLCSRTDLIVVVLFVFSDAMNPVTTLSQQGWQLGLQYALVFWSFLPVVLGSVLPTVGATVILSNSGIELRRRGTQVFNIAWDAVGAVVVNNTGAMSSSVVFTDAKGSEIGSIPLGFLGLFKYCGREMLVEIQRHLPGDIVIQEERGDLGGTRLKHALRGVFILAIGLGCILLGFYGRSLAYSPPMDNSKIDATKFVGMAWGGLALVIGTAEIVVAVLWNWLRSRRKPRLSPSITDLASPNALVRYLLGSASDHRRKFRYRENVRSYDFRRKAWKGWFWLGVFGILICGFAISDRLTGPSWGRFRFLPLLYEVICLFGLVLLISAASILWREHVSQMKALAEAINDVIVVDGDSVYVAREDRLIPARIIQKPRLTPYSSPKRCLNRMRTCLEVEGVYRWYDPSCLEEMSASP